MELDRPMSLFAASFVKLATRLSACEATWREVSIGSIQAENTPYILASNLQNTLRAC